MKKVFEMEEIHLTQAYVEDEVLTDYTITYQSYKDRTPTFTAVEKDTGRTFVYNCDCALGNISNVDHKKILAYRGLEHDFSRATLEDWFMSGMFMKFVGEQK